MPSVRLVLSVFCSCFASPDRCHFPDELSWSLLASISRLHLHLTPWCTLRRWWTRNTRGNCHFLSKLPSGSPLPLGPHSNTRGALLDPTLSVFPIGSRTASLLGWLPQTPPLALASSIWITPVPVWLHLPLQLNGHLGAASVSLGQSPALPVCPLVMLASVLGSGLFIPGLTINQPSVDEISVSEARIAQMT